MTLSSRRRLGCVAAETLDVYPPLSRASRRRGQDLGVAWTKAGPEECHPGIPAVCIVQPRVVKTLDTNELKLFREDLGNCQHVIEFVSQAVN